MGCSIDGCRGKGFINCNKTEVFPKGYCCKHYQKFRKYGDPLHTINVVGEDRMKHPLYNIYCGMLGRCFNLKNPKYKNYGGRGITVDSRWLGHKGFNNFCNDIGERPLNTTLDRKDNNSNYSKENCKWSTAFEQGQNKRNNKKDVGIYTVKGSYKYRACIFKDKKQIHLGVFAKYEDAVSARKKALETIKQE